MKHKLNLFPVLLVMLLSACSINPVATANNPELKAQALYAEYVIAEEGAARAMQDPAVPDQAKRAIQNTHRLTTPPVEAMEAQRKLIASLRITKPDDVPAALLALNDLITAAAPLVAGFSRETK